MEEFLNVALASRHLSRKAEAGEAFADPAAALPEYLRDKPEVAAFAETLEVVPQGRMRGTSKSQSAARPTFDTASSELILADDDGIEQIAAQVVIDQFAWDGKQKRKIRDMFKAADRNGDGKLDRHELNAFVTKNKELESILDGRGVVVAYGETLQAYFDEMTDGEEVDMHEFMQAIDFTFEFCEIFQKMDVDKNGGVDVQEFKTYMDTDVDIFLTRNMEAIGCDRFDMAKSFDQLDSDGNGTIDLKEFLRIGVNSIQSGKYREILYQHEAVERLRA